MELRQTRGTTRNDNYKKKKATRYNQVQRIETPNGTQSDPLSFGVALRSDVRCPIWRNADPRDAPEGHFFHQRNVIEFDPSPSESAGGAGVEAGAVEVPFLSSVSFFGRQIGHRRRSVSDGRTVDAAARFRRRTFSASTPKRRRSSILRR